MSQYARIDQASLKPIRTTERVVFFKKAQRFEPMSVETLLSHFNVGLEWGSNWIGERGKPAAERTPFDDYAQVRKGLWEEAKTRLHDEVSVFKDWREAYSDAVHEAVTLDDVVTILNALNAQAWAVKNS